MCFYLCFCLIKTLLIFGLIVLLFSLIFKPNSIIVHVNDSNLIQFEHSPPKTLKYNLALNVTFENPNERLKVEYDKIEANAYYSHENFATLHIDSFEQKIKSTRVLYPEFKGQAKLNLNEKNLGNLKDDKNHNIFVEFEFEVRYKALFLKSIRLKPKAGCGLKDLPLSSDGKSTGKFKATNCLVYYWFHWRGISM